MSTTRKKSRDRSSREALADTWLERSQELLEIIHDEATEEELEEALAQRTSVSSLSILLSRLVVAVMDFDPMAPALLKGVQAKRDLLERAGNAWSRGDVAEFLGITPAAVDQRRRRNQLLFVERVGGGFQYPRCQFTESGTIPHLRDVLEAFQVENGWMRLDMLLSESTALGDRSPLELLRSGPSEDELANLRDVIGSWGA